MRVVSGEHEMISSSYPMDALITTDAAAALIAAAITPLSTEEIALVEAGGRTLARPILADRPLPPYRRATMDGIAFKGGFSSLEIAGLHAAGDPPPRELMTGEAWEIMTGALVPADCDSLVPYEEITIDVQGHATVHGEIVPGRFIHEAGSDALAGKVLVSPGKRIGGIEVAIAASVGLSRLTVYRRPTVSIITTGDEAVAIESTPEAWQIRRSNGAMLEALLRQRGQQDIHHEHVPDDLPALEASVDRALSRSDVLLLCGGISKGKRDYVRAVIEQRLGPPAFHGVQQRPGKPLAFWEGPVPVFALPGNPISVLATFVRYVLPALSAMEKSAPETFHFPLASPVDSLPSFTWLLPCHIGVDGHAYPLPPRNSGDFVSAAGATHLLEIPPGRGTLTAGSLVQAYAI
jgi:molybdopterin molybdotransferase